MQSGAVFIVGCTPFGKRNRRSTCAVESRVDSFPSLYKAAKLAPE